MQLELYEGSDTLRRDKLEVNFLEHFNLQKSSCFYFCLTCSADIPKIWSHVCWSFDIEAL